MKSSNHAMQLTAGPAYCLALLYENTSIASHARLRQRWLISFSLGLCVHFSKKTKPLRYLLRRERACSALICPIASTICAMQFNGCLRNRRKIIKHSRLVPSRVEFCSSFLAWVTTTREILFVRAELTLEPRAA